MLLFTTTLSFLLLSSITAAKDVVYDFNITWLIANPDGQADRPVVGINGKWPIPTIDTVVGDRVIIHTHNQLGNQSTSLHFHGLYMINQTHMDGPPQVTQCEILPGSSFTYDFNVTQPGTYWYHSHSKGQYPDGLRGPFIVHDPDGPFEAIYDAELVLTVSDWYHDQMTGLIAGFMHKSNPTGAEPVPDAALFNDVQDLNVLIKPNTTYLIHMINMGAFAGQYIWFEGHEMTIVEVDGIWTKQDVAEMIYLSAGQRYSFLLMSHPDATANFPFVASMDTSLFDVVDPDANYNVTGWLVYDETRPLPDPALVDEFNPFDDMTLVAHDEEALLGDPDYTVQLNVTMDNLGDGVNYAFFNNITYVHPAVPTLYTLLSSGGNASNPTIYGTYTHPIVLSPGEIVQIVVNNLDSGRHPFHLHGHAFQALVRSAEDAGPFDPSTTDSLNIPAIPMRRDTLLLNPNGHLVVRFRADNPGVWLFHCHIEWHIVSGLVAMFVEAPDEVQKLIDIPKDHLDACEVGRVAVRGNAAGNSENFLDLKGEPSPPGPLPDGFTARGIVALVFSCLVGLLGTAVVAWHGLVDGTSTGAANEAAKEMGGGGAVATLPEGCDRVTGEGGGGGGSGTGGDGMNSAPR